MIPIETLQDRLFATPVAGSVWEHRNGHRYSVVMAAIIEETKEAGVIYRCLNTGVVWIRPAAQFLDGRFKLISSGDGEQ